MAGPTTTELPMAPAILLCTCPDLDSARALAASLVEARLAACVNLLPGVESVYRWQGGIERACEVQLLIKTRAAHHRAVEAHILAQHPYELPEILVVQADSGLDRYLRWIESETAPHRPDPPADERPQ